MASEQDKIAHRLRLWVLPSMGMRIGVWDMSGICQSLSPRHRRCYPHRTGKITWARNRRGKTRRYPDRAWTDIR